MNTATSKSFVPLDRAAAHLGVPAAWLKAEAKAGRVPHLKAGRRMLFHLGTVEQSLQVRAETEVSGDGTRRHNNAE